MGLHNLLAAFWAVVLWAVVPDPVNSLCIYSRDTEAARAEWAVALLEAHLLLS